MPPSLVAISVVPVGMPVSPHSSVSEVAVVVAAGSAVQYFMDVNDDGAISPLDALRVMGVDPVHRLVVPRVLAATIVAVDTSDGGRISSNASALRSSAPFRW